MSRRLRQKIINNENQNPSQNFECKFNESPQRLCQERRAQQCLEQISSQFLLSNTFDIYDGWNQKEDKPYKNYHQPAQSQKSTLDSSFRVRSQIRTATPNQRRSQRTQSHMKETKILLEICPKQCFNYPMPAFKTKQFSQKEQIKYFQGFYDRSEKSFDWMSNLLQVRKVKR
ncbi:unnamed protein product [Paramecium sonneborni]|uniref:Uncharacterized protein n=1 Tax=Paramecium sonneborni TaxID=65129 RepID=A0A8S1N6F0_9CILI|nr:unnamed protein product [Paramecium sonneborni]CAD8128695.1 unnamed protein product [Paramecium sonneborni]